MITNEYHLIKRKALKSKKQLNQIILASTWQDSITLNTNLR